MVRLVISYFVPKRWRTTCCLAAPCVVTFLVLLSLLKQRSDPLNDLEHDYELENSIIVTQDHLGVSFCPVCFGRNETVCEGILHSTVKIRRKKKTTYGENWKPRAIGLWNRQQISIKHFGNSSEFYKLDNEMCSIVGKINAPCNVVDVAWKSFLNPSSVERWVTVHQNVEDSPFNKDFLEIWRIVGTPYQNR